MRIAIPALAATLVALAAAPAAAQSRVAQAPKCGDATNIDFIYPGQFARALAKAKQARRPLIIKGVAFGVDQVGATCATKGHW